MIIQLNLSALRKTRWYEYAIRFVLGGAMTVIAGLIAARFGSVVGGLFLAFPAIFPASATLIEKHVRERNGSRRAARQGSSCTGCGWRDARELRACGVCGRDLAADRALAVFGAFSRDSSLACCCVAGVDRAAPALTKRIGSVWLITSCHLCRGSEAFILRLISRGNPPIKLQEIPQYRSPRRSNSSAIRATVPIRGKGSPNILPAGRPGRRWPRE
jgi:hypothetical protein